MDHKTLLNRAVELRIPVRQRRTRWKPHELELLAKYLPLGINAAARALKQAGCQRPLRGIKERALRYMGRIRPDDPDVYTPEDLAYHLGIHPSNVRRLCESGKLKAKVSRGPQGLPRYKISRRNARDYLIEWKAHVDHRRIDFVWAVEVLARTRVRRKQDVAA